MISNIQILRAIAAILVVAFHTVPTAKSYNLSTDFFYKIDIWGAAGVDIFFVISGFIMVYIQINKKRKPLDFIKDRLERIVPLYWLLTISFSALLIILPNVFRVWTFDTTTLIKSLFFISYLKEGSNPLLFVGWTLEYEMLFYIIFGLSIFLKDIRYSIFISILTLSFMTIIGLNNIVMEFCYGMIMGLIFNKYKLKISKTICLTLITLGFYLLTLNWNEFIPRSLAWGIPSLLIFIGFLYLKPIKNSLLDLLGNASYSIYLVHVFSILICYRIFSKIGHINFKYTNELYVIICIIVSVIVGVLVHLIIEKRLIQLVKNLKRKIKDEKLGSTVN